MLCVICIDSLYSIFPTFHFGHHYFHVPEVILSESPHSPAYVNLCHAGMKAACNTFRLYCLILSVSFWLPPKPPLHFGTIYIPKSVHCIICPRNKQTRTRKKLQD